jgi:CRISPR/Cas system endoribonuclease Cas6 (RAMP superfamily)
MKLKIKISSNKDIVPFNYQNVLTGAIHKWVGLKGWHDKLSLYSFPWLMNGKASSKGIEFPKGLNFLLGQFHGDFMSSLDKGINVSPEINYGMQVESLQICESIKKTNNPHRIWALSPILIKRMMIMAKVFTIPIEMRRLSTIN